MTEADRSGGVRDVDYKGAPLDSEKGPGLGCFWTQLIVLGVLLILTPLSVAWNWPFWVSGALLIVVLLLLLLAGQTVIFLLRLVAADRRAAGRRRPLGSATPTVGELEDQRAEDTAAPGADAAPEPGADAAEPDVASSLEPGAERAIEPAADTAPDDEDAPGPPGGGVRE